MSSPRDNQPVLTWDGLVALDPRLAELERDIRGVQGGAGFCANAVWGRTFKPRMSRLVGWGRSFPRYAGFEKRPRRDRWPEPGERLVSITAQELADEMGKDYEERRQAAIARMGPLAVLWGSDAYDVAYKHLYYLLPDCDHAPNLGCG